MNFFLVPTCLFSGSNATFGVPPLKCPKNLGLVIFCLLTSSWIVYNSRFYLFISHLLQKRYQSSPPEKVPQSCLSCREQKHPLPLAHACTILGSLVLPSHLSITASASAFNIIDYCLIYLFFYLFNFNFQ